MGGGANAFAVPALAMLEVATIGASGGVVNTTSTIVSDAFPCKLATPRVTVMLTGTLIAGR